MSTMRAKVNCYDVKKHESGSETLTFNAVAKSDGYPADGVDEDNDYARWSPSATFTITVANPALWGKFAVGDQFYVDFTKVEKAP